MVRRIVAWTLAGVCVVSLSISYPPPLAPDPLPTPTSSVSASVDYNRDILPILSSKCFACHGPDKSSRKAGLRLDDRAQALAPAKSRAAPIVPGKPGDSELVRRIFADDEERMPPAGKGGKPLTDAEKSLLKRWIAEGATYAQHWAYLAPQRPTVPTVKDQAWCKNEIDAFILAKLESAGLPPNPRAERETLIRRLSLDLRGLPPSLEEVDAFLADQSADAYEQLVERMLKSPHYGEKMALHWLDLARFGDTSGYHMDSTRQMWLWRDWVIDAFNRNMPFDQFTIEQLAGDLLPNATTSQKIASGFNRNTRFNEEGGVDPEEYVIRYNVDRTNTLGQVWLGMTVGCAECHSHKYDPLSHQEYYQLFAYFTGITEPMLEGSMVHDRPLPPILKLATPEQTKQLASLRAEAEQLEKEIDKELSRYKYKDQGDDHPGRSQAAWEKLAREDIKLPADIRAALAVDAVKRDAKQLQLVRRYYLRRVNADAREMFGLLDRDLVELSQKIKAIEDAIPYTLVSEEMKTPRPAHVLIRGDFLHKAERVERGVPAFLPPMPEGAPDNRLGLARWLVRPDHPLTARVTVNRLWGQIFGQGIVRTAADFGSQGDYPSHPELLDWLATEFVRTGWDVKAMMRKIVLSATYQQASTHTPLGAKLDPGNRLLHRAPRYRLSAEELRDNALAIAGLIDAKVGGPSFMPYQPPDFYKYKNEVWTWNPSAGDEQYRRGVYAFWRRTALHPMFAILDAPSREECNSQRMRTNTPLQALVTLNDPTFVEAARVFAQHLLTHGPRDHDARLALAFRSATCRAPTAEEMTVLRARIQQQLVRFRADADAASKLVNVGQYPREAQLDVSEHAAWTALCNLILNLDEVMMRE
ncbi:MAG TPA: PSD1 and planctomycete cytochrome C domain-containing protein [Gemmataceae bacterium]|nr:PSD1 and planctomycete cytochrome C domain-containing protein [Gemmataceae bacterium]